MSRHVGSRGREEGRRVTGNYLALFSSHFSCAFSSFQIARARFFPVSDCREACIFSTASFHSQTTKRPPLECRFYSGLSRTSVCFQVSFIFDMRGARASREGGRERARQTASGHGAQTICHSTHSDCAHGNGDGGAVVSPMRPRAGAQFN